METADSLAPLPDYLKAAIREARAGSQEALGRLLDGSRPYLLSLANNELDSHLLPKAGASDLVQDTFLEAHRIFTRFHGDSEAELLAWLRAILRNKVATHTRRFRATAKRQVAREVEDNSTDGPHRPAAESTSPSQLAMRSEQAEALKTALQRLPEHYRRIIHNRQWEGMSFDEIARQLGCSPDAARMQWWRAIERLQREFQYASTKSPPTRST